MFLPKPNSNLVVATRIRIVTGDTSERQSFTKEACMMLKRFNYHIFYFMTIFQESMCVNCFYIYFDIFVTEMSHQTLKNCFIVFREIHTSYPQIYH